MNDIAAFLVRVEERLLHYPRCSHEQAVVYACEDVMDTDMGTQVVAREDVDFYVHAVCHREGLEPPHITFARASRFRASADLDQWSMCIREKHTTTSVLLHEIAHLSVGIDSHGILFRDEYVRLVRQHLSVEHGALLFTLFTKMELEMSPWEASARLLK